MEFILDGTQILDEMDLHRILSSEFDFGPCYGNNLNALYDSFTGNIEGPVHIVWQNHEISKAAIGPYFNIIVGTLDRIVAHFAEVGRPSAFTYLLQ